VIPVAASLSTYATDAVLGLIQGAVYGLLAMGVVAIYRTTRTLNLAQGGMATLGAFTYIALREHSVPTLVAVVTVVALGGAIGLGIGQLIGWPLRRASPTVKLVSSLGVLLVVQSLVGIIFGNVPRSAPATGWWCSASPPWPPTCSTACSAPPGWGCTCVPWPPTRRWRRCRASTSGW
jgi:branched-subunit amino acid ABC-type transport system permease component